jgi:predicted outer membrane repeat protein
LGNLLIERSTLSQNSTTSDSGGAVFVRGNAMIVDSTIDSNHASNQGGAIYNDGSLTIINSTLSGNSANFHGGAIAQGSVDRAASLVNATVFGNRADANVDASGDGGGIYLGRVTLQNSIVAANRRGNTSADLVAVSLLSPSVHNVIGDVSTAAGLVNGVNGNRVGVDPRLASLANNGGPTRTHALLLGSPAIDGGDSSLAVALNASVLMYDQRGPGYPRMVDGNGTGSAKVDVGAFESPLQIPLVDSILINGGASQRSSLASVQIRFNSVVDIDQVASDPFQFVDVASGTSIVDTPVISIVNGRTYVDFTFASGAHVNAGGSLIDGRYKLTIDGSRISAFGLNLDGDANGLVGGDHVFGAEAADRFFRKYGDQNGNGTVDLLDFAEFRRTFGLSAGQPGYLGSLEANFNGSIDLVDFAAFRRNFGT